MTVVPDPSRRRLPGLAPAQGLSERAVEPGPRTRRSPTGMPATSSSRIGSGPLWDLVAANPGVLLVVEEPKSYPENPVIRTWSDHIIDPAARERAFAVMSTHVFLNSGFAAGTAAALLDYCREGDRLLNSPALRGVGDWGDQPAMNLYCHAHPDRWKADPRRLELLAGRPGSRGSTGSPPTARTERVDGEPVHVVHGNAGTLRWLELSPWSPTARQGPAPTCVPAWS